MKIQILKEIIKKKSSKEKFAVLTNLINGNSEIFEFGNFLSKDFESSHAVEGDSKVNTSNWIKECVTDLVRLSENGKHSLVIAGYRQPKESARVVSRSWRDSARIGHHAMHQLPQ